MLRVIDGELVENANDARIAMYAKGFTWQETAELCEVISHEERQECEAAMCMMKDSADEKELMADHYMRGLQAIADIVGDAKRTRFNAALIDDIKKEIDSYL